MLQCIVENDSESSVCCFIIRCKSSWRVLYFILLLLLYFILLLFLVNRHVLLYISTDCLLLYDLPKLACNTCSSKF
jgi:hypothetical protein